MDVHPLVLLQRVKRSLEGLCVLCLRWWKGKVKRGIFKWLEDEYGGFNSTQWVETLGGFWNIGSIIESRRDEKGKAI